MNFYWYILYKMGDQQSKIHNPHADSTNISEIRESKDNEPDTEPAQASQIQSIVSFKITQEILFNVFGQWLLKNFKNDVNEFAQTAQFYYSSKQTFHVKPRYHALSACMKIINQVQKLQKLLGKQSDAIDIPQALKSLQVKAYLIDLGRSIWSQTKKKGSSLKNTASIYYNSSYFHVTPRYQMLNFIKLVSTKLAKALQIQASQTVLSKKNQENSLQQKIRSQQNKRLNESSRSDSKQVVLNSDDSDSEDENKDQDFKKKQQSKKKQDKTRDQKLNEKLIKSFKKSNEDEYSTPKKEQNKPSLFSMKKNNMFAVYDLNNKSTAQKSSSKLDLNSDSEQQQQKKQKKQYKYVQDEIDYVNENSISFIKQQQNQLSILTLKDQFFKDAKKNAIKSNNTKKQDPPKDPANQSQSSNSGSQPEHDQDSQENDWVDSEGQQQIQGSQETSENVVVLQSDSDAYNPDQNSFFQISSLVSQDQIKNYFGKWLFQNFYNDIDEFAQTAQFYYTSKQYFHVGPRYHALSSCTKIVNQVQKLQKLIGKQSDDPDVPNGLKMLAIKTYFLNLGNIIWAKTKQIGSNLKTTAMQYYSSNYFHVGPRYQMLDFIDLVSRQVRKVLAVELYEDQTQGDEYQQQEQSIQLSLNSENSLV